MQCEFYGDTRAGTSVQGCLTLWESLEKSKGVSERQQGPFTATHCCWNLVPLTHQTEFK